VYERQTLEIICHYSRYRQSYEFIWKFWLDIPYHTTHPVAALHHSIDNTGFDQNNLKTQPTTARRKVQSRNKKHTLFDDTYKTTTKSTPNTLAYSDYNQWCLKIVCIILAITMDFCFKKDMNGSNS
jgi:hypothetical protein